MLLSLVTVVVALGVALAMEPWSRFVHEQVWHRLLYGIHQTHHREGAPPSWIEANDVFALLHAIPAVLAIHLGWSVLDGWLGAGLLGLGVGMTLYGVAYTVVHDGLAHGRLPVGFLRRSRWLRRIQGAHDIHHRDGGPPYGFFLGPQELKARRVKDRFSAEPPTHAE